MKKLWLVGILLVVLTVTPVLTLTAQDAAGTPKSGGTLKAGWDAEWVSLDPHLSSAYSSFAVLANVVEGLTTFDNDIKLAPALAESWEQSEDGLTWTFKIRDVPCFTGKSTLGKLTAPEEEPIFKYRRKLSATSNPMAY